RLMQGHPVNWDGRRHFLGAAAEAMRRILIEHARRRNSLKAGGDRERLSLNDGEWPPISSPCDNITDLLAVNTALDRLAAEHPDKAELIKLLYFAGLSLDDAADAMGLARSTAYRHWQFARAFLFQAMGQTGG